MPRKIRKSRKPRKLASLRDQLGSRQALRLGSANKPFNMMKLWSATQLPRRVQLQNVSLFVIGQYFQ
jgi:hypothetical protein